MREVQTTLGGLRCRVLQESDVPPKLAVVLCHGFGAPADDLVPFAAELVALRPSLGKDVRFVFPEAPLSLDQIGYFGARAWWLIEVGRFQRAAMQGQEALLKLADESPDGLASARKLLLSTIEALRVSTGLPMSRMVLGGFSQGAMVMTDLTLRLEEAPAALALFSGTVISRPEWEKRAPLRKGLEVLVSHGTQDTLLPFFGAEALRDLLQGAGMNVDFIPFNGPHTVHPKALERFAELLERKRSPESNETRATGDDR